MQIHTSCMYSSPSVVTVGFNMAEYAMTEGGTVTATVNLTPAVILDRSVIVTVEFSSTDDFKVDPTRLIFSGEIRSLDINMSASHDLEPDDDGQMVVISLAGDASNIMTGMATVTITDASKTCVLYLERNAVQHFFPQQFWSRQRILLCVW